MGPYGQGVGWGRLKELKNRLDGSMPPRDCRGWSIWRDLCVLDSLREMRL